MLDGASSNGLSKILFAGFVAVIAGIVAYLMVYWWVFRGFEDVLNVSSLKNQIVATQKSGDVKTQLKELGYEFQDGNFFQLNNPSSTHYRANVLNGYEPEKIEDSEGMEEGYYFYDENGMAYFFTVDENNAINPDTFVPMIAE
jgi:hypothetical protein